ncbi:hypothetical protein PRIPAC_76973 [Pristionchus pacificus]|uniref:G protein-coupled receptor n=1 Tax=Pristionchus pacificus TaxID=54126 RepID=A0A2A6C4E2_PRIPA|nr:hypothetical protein PRIPAC_76973 [Pristionchus pacificus]|eukprot:PDM72958.1 G protein-coupled receptor [Pristionchus pacificus]
MIAYFDFVTYAEHRFVARDQMFVMVSTGIVNDAMKAYFEFVTHVEHFNYAIGMFLSSMLFYCIIYCNNSSLGMYRYLQMIIVLVDATHTTGQCFLRERFVARDRMFVMVSTGIVNDAVRIHRHLPREINSYILANFQRVLCSYASVYTVIFVLDDYILNEFKNSPSRLLFWTLLFRYLRALRLVSNDRCGFAIFIQKRFSVSYNCFAPSPSGKELLFNELSENFNVDSRERAMIMAECLNGDGTFKGRTLLGITVCLSFIGSCMTFMLYAIRSIYIFLKSANLMSKNLLRMQKQLFLTLCLQTLIPFFALYVSAGAFMILPLFAIDAVWVANLAPLLISFFLPLDALVVLITMTDYRREVVRMIWRSNSHLKCLTPKQQMLSSLSISFLVQFCVHFFYSVSYFVLDRISALIRYLQIAMVSIDGFYTTAQMFIRERIITAEAVFAMIPTSSFGVTKVGFVHQLNHFFKEVLCLYLALYNLTFVMIDYNFLYRMWAVKSPLRVGLFSSPLFIALLVSFAFIESAVWYDDVII